ncbi:MAG: DcaP family trimeric outer membrane transporter [Pseudomonadota bacterium]
MTSTIFSLTRYRILQSVLLSGTMLAGLTAPAAAQQTNAGLEARVNALEEKLDRILQRLEASDSQLSPEETVMLHDASKVISATADNAEIITLAELDTPGGVSAQSAEPSKTEQASGLSVGDANFAFKGFVKLDVSVSDFSGGELPSGNIGRDFYIPALVPVGGSGDGPDLDFNPRETRFIFAVNSERGGHDISGLIELDFQVTSGGDERVSNSYIPRIRQGYITFDNWLLGQAWSTFQDVGALPDNLDFIGPTEGTVFIRQPMIRYTNGPLQISLEEPETEITGPDGGRFLPGDDIAPDVVVRYNHKRNWGHLTLAGIARALHIEDEIIPGANADTAIGYGVSASGKLNVGARDDFRFMATYGEGIGRYIGVNIVNDAAVNANGKLDTIQTISGFASYRHFWAPNLRSNITGGYFKADNPVTLVGDTVTDQVYSAHVNLIYTPVPKLDVGVEYIYANRELESGVDGSLNKVQFSTKYSF